MTKKIATLSVLSVALVISLAACSREETIVETAPDPAASTTAMAPATPAAGTPLVPEMSPTGELAPSFGTATVGGPPAPPTGSAVPEMSPTGVMKPAVNPNQPSQPAAPK